MIRGPIDGKYVELWGIPAWRRKLGIGDESETLTQRIESIIAGTANGGPDSGPGSVDNANARLAAFATLEEAGYVVQTSTFPPAFAGRQIVGVPNRINVTNGTGINGNTLLQTPQDIHEGATPSFQTIKPTLLNNDFVTYVDSAGELASTTITATQLETAVASAAAMDILTTRGDLLSHDGTTYIRVGIGAVNTVARTDGLDVIWGQVVLTTDVTSVLPVANGGTNKSSWTAGSVIFAGAGGTALAEDNANFFFDNANNRLGLGIALPTALLHLETANFNLKLRGNLSSGTYGYLTQSATATFLNHNAYATGSNQFTADAGGVGAASIQLDRGFIALRVSSSAAVPPANIVWTEGLRVINSGFVGIGTTAPGVICDIGLAGTRAGIVRLAGLTSGNVTIQTAAIAGTWTLQLPQNDGAANEFLQTNGSGVTSWASAAPTYAFTEGSVIFAGAGGTSLAEDNANLFWDNATNALRIGPTFGTLGSRLSLIHDGGVLTSTTYTDFLWNSATSATANVSKYGHYVALNGAWSSGTTEVVGFYSVVSGSSVLNIGGRFRVDTGTAIDSIGVYGEAIATGTNNYAGYFNATGATNDYAVYIASGATILGAGVASANGAPLKFRNGTNLTAAEAGAMEYDGRFTITDTDAARRHIVQAVNAVKTTAGAPYANDGYVEMVVNGTTIRLLTTA